MSENEPKNIIRLKTAYTFNEAIEYLKMRDKYSTNITINWRSVKTGKRVYIGYT